MSRCHNCKYGTAQVLAANTPQSAVPGTQDLLCRVNPPTVHAIPIPIQTPNGPAINVQFASGWPVVKANDFCSRWTPENASMPGRAMN